MNSITQQRHKELINTLKELKNIIDEMRKISSEQILIWHKGEVKDWLDFLEKHTDKEELRSLEVEVGDRFFYKYNVRIEPINLDKQRLSLLQKFITQINDALK
jgi:hypothetical protein